MYTEYINKDIYEEENLMNKMRLGKITTFILVVCLICSTYSIIGFAAGNLGDTVQCKNVNTFQMGDYLTSQNGIYTAVWQYDGNFVLYKNNAQAKWASSTIGSSRFTFNWGSLVIEKFVPERVIEVPSPSGKAIIPAHYEVVWKTPRAKNLDYTVLHMQNDGNLVVYNGPIAKGTPVLWASGTNE